MLMVTQKRLTHQLTRSGNGERSRDCMDKHNDIHSSNWNNGERFASRDFATIERLQ
ncbi:hypothetical protein D3C80_2185170 [compost metagenome]